MKSFDVDVAVIGAGTAGMGAYRAARKHTDSVLLIEGDVYGTTCARVGCMPSKLLIAAAEAAHHARHTDPFGVRVTGVSIDGAAVMDRVQRERDRFVGFVEQSVEAFPPATRLRASVRFADPTTLVGDRGERVHARRIVIASGTSPFIPPLLKTVTTRLLTNESLFELKNLPGSVAVFGPGPVGLEMGQAMSRLGVSVKVFGVGGSIAGIRDDELRACADQTFNAEFYLDPAAEVKTVTETATGVDLHFKQRDGNWTTETFDYVLVATGRTPNVGRLALENSGLTLDDRGVPQFDRYTMQCGEHPIFIAGDVSNDIPLLHEAADQGRIAGDNAGRFHDVRAGLRRTPLAIVFTEPQIASAGLSLDRLRSDYPGRHASGRTSFADQGRSRVMLRNQGGLVVYAEHGTGIFLGAEMFGPAAEHLGHLLAWALQQRLTVGEMLEMPFYHPVIEEGVRSALRDLNRNLHMGPELVERCMDCGPGA